VKRKHWFYVPGSTSVRGKWTEAEVDEEGYEPGIWDKYDKIAAPHVAANRPYLVFPPHKISTLKVGDLVRVFLQPRNQFVGLLDERGVIESVSGDNASIETFNLAGKVLGAGSVPLECLVAETAPEWVVAKTAREAHLAQVRAEFEDRGRRWTAELARVAAEHDVTPDAARAIYQALDRWQDRNH
jgi:hypothetical protein